MKLWMKPLGALQTNGYVLSTAQKQGIVIDPGAAEESLLAHIKDLDIQAILLTHAHFDHIGGLEKVRQETKAPVYLHRAEWEWLSDPEQNGSVRWSMVTEPIQARLADAELRHAQTLQLAGMRIEILHTPGHSPGSVSFYVPEENVCIAGDTLFAGSIGRTDLPGGDYDTLISSIRQRLLTLAEETAIYPGHGPETTIGDEKTYNPFVGGR